MFGNTAADATYQFPPNFRAKELAQYFEIILVHMWDTQTTAPKSVTHIWDTRSERVNTSRHNRIFLSLP